MSGNVSWWPSRAGRSCEGVIRSYVLLLAALASLISRVPYRAVVGGAPVSPDALALDDDTIVGPAHYTRDYAPVLPDGTVQAVIEIPTGTTAKFEVDDDDGWLHWRRDRDTGERREIDYLPFVVNYGMVPRTLAPDGDPLDIVVLARGIERGRVVRTRVIGVLGMSDGPGDDGNDIRDDKLIAVPLDDDLRNGFSDLTDLPELDGRYVSLCNILWTWFSSYWGEGATHVLGWGDAAEAMDILDAARRAFTQPEATVARTRSRAASALRRQAALPFAVRVRSPLPRLPARSRD